MDAAAFLHKPGKAGTKRSREPSRLVLRRRAPRLTLGFGNDIAKAATGIFAYGFGTLCRPGSGHQHLLPVLGPEGQPYVTVPAYSGSGRTSATRPLATWWCQT